MKWNRLLVLAAALVFLIIQNASAQVNGYGLQGIVAIPSGNLSNTAATGFGGMGTVLYTFDKNIALSGSAGYIKFGGKEAPFIFSTNYTWNWTVIPILAGGRYYFMPQDAGARFYASADAGYYFVSLTIEDGQGNKATGVGTTNEFALLPGVGVQLSVLDIRATYSPWWEIINTSGWNWGCCWERRIETQRHYPIRFQVISPYNCLATDRRRAVVPVPQDN